MIKKILILFISIYAIYVIALPIFLNTTLLQKIAGIEDETETHFKFKGAWSIFPGHLRARELLVAVRDHNVKVDVRSKNVRGKISVRKLLKKEVWIRDLKGDQGEVTVDLKEQTDSALHHKLHSKPKDQLELSGPQLTSTSKKVWKIMVPTLDVGVDRIRIKEKIFTGKMQATGGFYFQPGLFAEILPTKVNISQGAVENELTELNAQGYVQFKQFSIPNTGGSEVFDYVNADLTMSAKATNLDLLNVTLRALPGYRFQDGGGNITAKLLVSDGLIQKESYVNVERSEIDFVTPSFRVKGQGTVKWKVLDEKKEFGTSQLLANVSNSQANLKLGKSGQAQGSVKQVKGSATLFGLKMRSAFHGLHALIQMDEAKLAAKNTDPNGVSWAIKARAIGNLGAVAGVAPDYPGKHRLQVSIDSSSIKVKSPAMHFEPKGTFSLESKAVDFRAGKVDFENVVAKLEMQYEDGKTAQVRIESPSANRLLPRGDGGTGRWRGDAKLLVTGFDNLLESLKEPLKIPDIAATLASASTVNADFEWEVSDDMFLIRAHSVQSDGIWSAWGTYISPSNSPAFGAIETKVLGLIPLGLKFPGGPKVLPSTRWYDELFKTSSSIY